LADLHNLAKVWISYGVLGVRFARNLYTDPHGSIRPGKGTFVRIRQFIGAGKIEKIGFKHRDKLGKIKVFSDLSVLIIGPGKTLVFLVQLIKSLIEHFYYIASETTQAGIFLN
jgi:hypothetical protein